MPSLTKYRKLRDFGRTHEPRGVERPKRLADAPSFVVQKHDARNLHYDFRLELDGALLSWAIPKGPSRDPSVKRLAVEVEPHPLEYGEFEGTIPEGAYGGGTVMVWDRGTWTPDGDPKQGLAKGHLSFTLQGQKLKGAWHLVRTKGTAGRAAADGKAWLLFKGHDAAAASADDLLDEAPDSALSGKSLDEIAAPPLPKSVSPELATLVDRAPAGDAWVHEVKFDGYRVMARLDGGKVTLLTRNGKDWTARMPSLQRSLEKLDVRAAVLDGELVALNDKGLSDFQALQNSLKEGRDGGLVYYAFDLLHDDSGDLRSRPLVERKSRLRELLARHEPQLAGTVRFSAHVVGNGPEFFANAGKLGLEGTIAKRADSPYRAGRGKDWLKIKCSKRQELVIVGYSRPAGSRRHLGALLLGAQRAGKLVYVGKVGTGFSEASLKELSARLGRLKVEQSPLSNPPRGAAARGVQWVEPKLVAQVRFSELTQDGHLRHPSFEGLRDDKPARDVALERTRSVDQGAATLRAPTYPLTHRDKLLYPEAGITKQELLEYYALVAERMLPHVANRPLTLLRAPNGRDKPSFFQKHPGKASLPGLRTVAIREKEGKAPYSVLDDEVGLFSLVQLGALEVHTWGSRADDFEHPDTLVLDLDPDTEVEYTAVIAAARALRKIFEQAKLESFVKTTGGKGLHVCVPIAPELDWQHAKDFTGRIAAAMAAHSPELYVATMSKARRRGKIFIDYLRNGRGATFIAPYSTRAREQCPLAVPLEWDELSPKLPPAHFTLRNIAGRLAKLRSDPFERMAGLAQSLKAASPSP